jgi:hypothetical protein
MTDAEITTGELAKLLDTSPKTMTDPKTGFYAVNDKPTDEPGLKLRGRAETKDHALLAPPGQCQRQGARAGVDRVGGQASRQTLFNYTSSSCKKGSQEHSILSRGLNRGR